MSDCKFGDGFPLESIKNVIEILRSGDAASKKWLLLQESACVIGCAAKMADKSSEELFGQTNSDLQFIQNNESADLLQGFVDQHLGSVNQEAMAGLPWLMIIKILLPIIIDALGDEGSARS